MILCATSHVLRVKDMASILAFAKMAEKAMRMFESDHWFLIMRDLVRTRFAF